MLFGMIHAKKQNTTKSQKSEGCFYFLSFSTRKLCVEKKSTYLPTIQQKKPT